MIKIILEIKENKTINLKDINAIDTTITVSEELKKATKNEIEVKRIIEKNLNLDKKLVFSNRLKNKEDLQVDIIEQLINSIF